MEDLTSQGPPRSSRTTRLSIRNDWPSARRWKNSGLNRKRRAAHDPETLKKVQSQIEALWAKVDATLPRNSQGRRDAEKFLKAAYGLAKMLETPAIDVLLAGVEKRPDTTLGDLLAFMHSFNLRFGPAQSPRQRTVYSELYPKLVRLRDETLPGSPRDLALEPRQQQTEGTGEFFGAMPFKKLDSTKAPAAPSPAPRP